MIRGSKPWGEQDPKRVAKVDFRKKATSNELQEVKQHIQAQVKVYSWIYYEKMKVIFSIKNEAESLDEEGWHQGVSVMEV